MEDQIVYVVCWSNHKPINAFQTFEEAEESLKFPRSSFYIKKIDSSSLSTVTGPSNTSIREIFKAEDEQLKEALFGDYWDWQAKRERSRKINDLKRSMEEDPQFKAQLKEELQCSGI